VGIGQNDLWIAATAWVTKAALITTDSDFDHLHRVFLYDSSLDSESRIIFFKVSRDTLSDTPRI
jgi:predicted nuclease of predicted toxin-antitoxin system